VQGKILIIDAIATNRIVLKVKLASAFYQVIQASTIEEATAIARKQRPDLIISSLSMPDGTAIDLCDRLKRVALTRNIPILVIGSRACADTRIATLEAGVHDVLLKPIDDTLLLSRVRSLIRAHNASAEWQMRDDTSRALGLAEPAAEFVAKGRCVLVSNDTPTAQGWAMRLRPILRCTLTLAKPENAIRDLQPNAVPDVFVLVVPEDPTAAAASLRMISTLRSNASTRHAGVLILQTTPDSGQASTALDLGADDLMADGFDPAEIVLRLEALLRRKRVAEQLRATVRTGLKAAVFDPLTGLHNRRYAKPHLTRIAEHAHATGRTFAVMIADLDHFKRINDHYGHAAGDAVLVETARRLRGNLRAMDLVARIGGEEFLIVMPGTCRTQARAAAKRLCQDISATPFAIPRGDPAIAVTISIGMAIGGGADQGGFPNLATADMLLDEADKALYAAKLSGRNQVTLSRPAA